MFACIRKDRLTTRNGRAVPGARAARPDRDDPGARVPRRRRAGGPVRAGRLVAGRRPGRAVSRRARASRSSTIARVEPDGDAADPARFLPTAYRDLDELDGFLEHLAGEVHDRGFRALLDALLADAELRAALRRAPCTRGGHHAYLGGLLEHTVAVATLAYEVCQLHPRLNSDLLLTAAITHDLGRTREFTYGAEIGLTDEGRLLGHLVIGERMLSERAGDARRGAPAGAAALRALPPRARGRARRPLRHRRGARAVPAATRSTPASRARSSTDSDKTRAASASEIDVRSPAARHGPGGPSSLQNWQGRAAPGLEGSIPSPRRVSWGRSLRRSEAP